MGGKVRVLYREENGEVHKRDRWTNRMGRWLKTHHIAARNHDWMMQYFGPEESPTQNGKDDKLLANTPCGYGIVVVDFMANQFLSAQNYTSLNRISPAEATGEMYRPENRAEIIQNFTNMADHRLRIRRRTYTTFQQNTTHVESLGESLTNAEAHEQSKIMMREYAEQLNPFRVRVDTSVEPEEYYDANFIISFDPLYTMLFNDNDSTSLLMIKDRMNQTGFKFTDGENRAWDDEIGTALDRNY